MEVVSKMSEPQDMVAREYMTRKGLADVEPHKIARLKTGVAWLYRYTLPEGGELDLIVEWLPEGETGNLAGGHRWNVEVDDFRMGRDLD